MRQHPDIKVVVHQRGAPHVIAPEKLVESARRLWGAQTERSRQNFKIGQDRMPMAIVHAPTMAKTWSPVSRNNRNTSMPNESGATPHICAISFIKEILVARKALAAYLISSAVRRVVNSSGVSCR